MSRSSRSLEYKTDGQIRSMRKVGLVVAAIHTALHEEVRTGATTRRMDELARGVLEAHGARSSFYGYYGYPAQIYASVNDETVHGVPGERVLEAGDSVSFDCGAILDGWHGDTAFSIVVLGKDAPARTRLCEIVEASTWRGIAAMVTGGRVDDVRRAIDDFVMSLPDPPGIVLDYVGHGIGSAMHMPPDVPSFRSRERGLRPKPGMVLCIEPTLAAGDQASRVLSDEWTVVTADGSDACHWEHEVVLHSGGVWVLTVPDGDEADLKPFGAVPAPLD